MNKFIKAAAITGTALLAAKGLDNRLEITHHTVKSHKIPKSFDGFKIAQISDVHSDIIPGLIPEIRNEMPDIIVSTGDIVHHKGEYSSAVALCKKLINIAPTYAVTGNHDVWRGDYEEMESELTQTGVKTLRNESIILEKNNEIICISGIDDPFAVISRKINEFLADAISQMDIIDGYNILLFHRANWLDYFKNKGFDLVISGHMHGGQMRIPYIGGVISPRSSWASGKQILFPKYVGGHYENKNTEFIVSRGLGNPMIIPRVFNRPELVIITLKSIKKEI